MSLLKGFTPILIKRLIKHGFGRKVVKRRELYERAYSSSIEEN